MKKVLKAFLAVVIMAAVSGCFSSGSEEYEEFPTGATAKAEATEIFSCFLEKDSEGLKAFFSPYVCENYDLDTEIEEGFDFISGEILSYDEPYGLATGSAVMEGEWIKRELEAKIRNIKTDNDEIYTIKIFSNAIYKNDPQKEGVMAIRIWNESVTDEEGLPVKITIGGF